MKTAEEYFKENKIHRKLVASDFVITERHLGKIITEDRQNIVDKIKEKIEKIKELRDGVCKDYPYQVEREQARIDELKTIINLIEGEK